MYMMCYASLRSLVSYYAGNFLSLLLFCRRQVQLGVQSVVHLWGGHLRNENEQTISGTGVLLMIFHHEHHITCSELALRFYIFRSNKVKCDENDRLESPFQINAKQWINNKPFFYCIIYETSAVKYHIRFEVCNGEERLPTTKIT